MIVTLTSAEVALSCDQLFVYTFSDIYVCNMSSLYQITNVNTVVCMQLCELISKTDNCDRCAQIISAHFGGIMGISTSPANAGVLIFIEVSAKDIALRHDGGHEFKVALRVRS